jgi:hypothetical protein
MPGGDPPPSPPPVAIAADSKLAVEKAKTPEAGDSDEIQVARNGEAIGPYSRDKAKEHLLAGQLLPADWGWHDGMDEWKPLNEVLVLPIPPVLAAGATCPQCQAPVEAGQIICLGCGTRLRGKTPQSTKKKLVIQFVSFWLVVLPLVIGFLWLSWGKGPGLGLLFSYYLMFMFSITFYFFVLKSRHTGKVRGTELLEYLLEINTNKYFDLAGIIAFLIVSIVACWKLGNNYGGTDPGYFKFLKACKDNTFWTGAISSCLIGIFVILFRIIREHREGWMKYTWIAVLTGILAGSTAGFFFPAGGSSSASSDKEPISPLEQLQEPISPLEQLQLAKENIDKETAKKIRHLYEQMALGSIDMKTHATLTAQAKRNAEHKKKNLDEQLKKLEENVGKD